jgi:hypothetical protein
MMRDYMVGFGSFMMMVVRIIMRRRRGRVEVVVV